MFVEYSAKRDAQYSCSDAVRCSRSGNAGHASAKRFMPVGGWHIMLWVEMCPVLLSSSSAALLNLGCQDSFFLLFVRFLLFI